MCANQQPRASISLKSFDWICYAKGSLTHLGIRYVKWTVLSLLCGVLAGAASALFLYTLDWATRVRDAEPALIWGLPIAGLFIGAVYHHFGREVAAGTSLVLDEIHNPQKVIPFRMAPLVLGGTVLTHLFGGSAGREGTAVQMGASLADQLTRIFKIESAERKALLMAGASAGFGAAVGAPWAGAIFGMEVVRVGSRPRLAGMFECVIASFAAYYVAILLRAPHSVYPRVEIPGFDVGAICLVLVAGLLFGIAARLFMLMAHFVERRLSSAVVNPPFRPFLGGCVLVALFWLEGSYRYVGLGIPQIQEALQQTTTFFDPFFKMVFTAVTVGTGFKGGEFIPLVFIGTTLGSALSAFLPLSCGFLGALGFAAVFGGAARTPLACTIMAMEIFGARIGVYALLACLASDLFAGGHRLYRRSPTPRDKL